MDAVARTIAIYGLLFVVFRIVGKRTLAQITTFDFVLLLIVGEAVQQGLLANDFSITNALLVVATLAVIELGTDWLSQHSDRVDKVVNGVPLLVIDDGQLLRDRLSRARLTRADLLEAARQHHGLERLDQVRYAILERDGAISIIPYQR